MPDITFINPYVDWAMALKPASHDLHFQSFLRGSVKTSMRIFFTLVYAWVQFLKIVLGTRPKHSEFVLQIQVFTILVIRSLVFITCRSRT